MTANLTLALVIAVLVGTGVSLIMARSILRAFLGILLLGNGVNLLFLVASGRAGRAPIVGNTPVEEMSDPLPQAMVLTAIVITLALTGFVLALTHRSWQLEQHDAIVDDDEDTRIVAKAEANEVDSDDDDPSGEPDEDPDPGGHHHLPTPARAGARHEAVAPEIGVPERRIAEVDDALPREDRP